MARTTPVAGTSWVFYAPIRINDDIITDDSEGVSIEYVVRHNGEVIDTGDFEWEPEGREGVWGKKFTLPDSAGIFVLDVTATRDDDVGVGSHSLYVEKYA